MIKQFMAARRAATPLIAITTPDPPATIERIVEASAKTTPIVQFDLCRGLTPVNEPGAKSLLKLLDGVEGSAVLNPTEMLQTMEAACKGKRLDSKLIVLFHNAHRCIDNTTNTAGVSQGICNLREPFKELTASLVLFAPTLTLPAELNNDVIAIDEPLPDDDQLKAIVAQTVNDAELESKVSKKTTENAVDALRGLAAFAAEQVTAMSLTETGLDVAGLWERKRKQIEATPGLSVYRGQERFADIGGVDNVKNFLRKIVAGKQAPRVIVFIDEIEKMLAGATAGSADSSGVSGNYLGTLLSYMQDTEASGTIFIGPPGAAKSAVAKATGAEASIPTIAMDLGGMKNSLVGESEKQLRNAFKVVTAVGGGQTLFIATCNKIATLPPELRRRFTMGTYFFDLPTKIEREAIWQIYLAKYDIGRASLTAELDDEGWTGAEIKQCCLLAYRLGITLLEAAQFVVPVSRSAADDIQALRTQANGRFLSATDPGLYSMETAALAQPSGRRRATAKEV